MPKNTFYNLKSDKIKRILNAALEEFALHDYEHVNIQNIVKNAQISRGSFYQYFSDLDDLFMYLVDVIATEKKTYLNQHVSFTDDTPFLDRLREFYRLGYQFAVDNPLIYRAGKHMVRPAANSTNETMLIEQQSLMTYYKAEIQKDIHKGLIRADVDIEMLINVFTLFLDELLQTHFIEQRLSQKEVDQRFKRFIKLLKKGIE